MLGLAVAWKYIYRTWKYIVAWKLCLFQQDISRSIFISIRYMYIKTNTLFSNIFFSIMTSNECELLVITKDSLIDSWCVYNLKGKFFAHNVLGMSNQEDFRWPKKLLEKRGKLLTKLEYQRKPKWKENSIGIRRR